MGVDLERISPGDGKKIHRLHFIVSFLIHNEINCLLIIRHVRNERYAANSFIISHNQSTFCVILEARAYKKKKKLWQTEIVMTLRLRFQWKTD